MHLKRLSKAWLAGLLLLATPVFADPILPGNGPGSSGLTGWNIPGPCQTGSDGSGMPACSGMGQTTSFLGGSSTDGVDQFVTADSGGFFGSTIFPGWGFTDPQNQVPAPPGTQNNYFLPLGAPLDLGQPGDAAESAPEPSTLWLMAASLIAAGLFGRKLALKPVVSREQDPIR